MPTIYVLSKNKKNITIFHLKITIFTAFKNRCILHGRVFVMSSIDNLIFRTNLKLYLLNKIRKVHLTKFLIGHFSNLFF